LGHCDAYILHLNAIDLIIIFIDYVISMNVMHYRNSIMCRYFYV